MIPRLQIGEKVVDLLDPRQDQIDLRALEQNLWTIRRFSSNPVALILRQHTSLVRALAVHLKGSAAAIAWAEYHDDHEGIIGDIPGPLKSYIEHSADPERLSLNDIERKLDGAIAAARGIALPDDFTREEVHFYDKLAETLEWLFILKRPPEVWNKVWQNYLSDNDASAMVHKASQLRPPRGLMPYPY